MGIGRVWFVRLLRAWVLVLLPAAAYCGYRAYDHHRYVAVFQEEANFWYPRLTRPAGDGVFDAREEFQQRIAWRDESKAGRDRMIRWSISLVVLPVPLVLIVLGGRWIWRVQ